jgi:hypothetical protein
MKIKFIQDASSLIGKLSLTAIIGAGLMVQYACHKKTDDVIPVAPVSHPITTTTLSGSIKGTLLANTTYYLMGDVKVNIGDTLAAQPGVTVIINSGGDVGSGSFVSRTIHNSGTLLIEGTKDSPVIFKPSNANPTWPNGYWGGIQSDSTATFVKMVYAQLSYTGGPDKVGGAQFAFSVVGKPGSTTKVIVENCKFTSGIDDCIRLTGPIKVSIKGNIILHQGSDDGDNINIKNGVTGDVAYNYIWSAANNSIKLNTNTILLYPQTNVNIYNNTMISSGWRKQGEPTAGILVDIFAKGSVYNNLFINCHTGLRITANADVANVKYNNNYFYATVDSLRKNYYPSTDWGTKQSNDIASTSTSDNNPMITNLNTGSSEFSIDLTQMTINDLNDPHLKTGSPAIGKGNTNAPHNTDLGTVMSPGKDIGAFQVDGTGNTY